MYYIVSCENISYNENKRDGDATHKGLNVGYYQELK